MALVFSCLSGILGITVIAWYGLAEVKTEPNVAVHDGVVESDLDAPAADAPGEVVPVVVGSGGGAVRT